MSAQSVATDGDGAVHAGVVLASFPGAVLTCNLDGTIDSVRGAACDVLLAELSGPGGPLHRALGLGDDAPEAGALQLWLASLTGADPAGWALYQDDPPRTTTTSCRLDVEYAPIFRDRRVARVVVFVRAAAEPVAGAAAAAPTVAPAGPTGSREQLEPFCADARRLIAEAGAALARMERDPDARQALNRVFRAVHTLKGNAHALGLAELTAAAHAAEDDLAVLRDSGAQIGGEPVRLAAARIDAIRGMVEALAPSDHARSAPATADPASLGPLRLALGKCRAAVVSRPERAAEAIRELDRVFDAVAVRVLREGVERSLAATSASERLAALAAIGAELDRLASLARELRACSLPAHLADELELARRELAAPELRIDGSNPQPPSAERLLALVDSVLGSATSLGIGALEACALEANAALTAAMWGATHHVSANAAMIRLADGIDECLALLPAVAAPRAVDVLARFHDEARGLLAVMEPELDRWVSNPRDHAALSALLAPARRLDGSARRFRFAAIAELTQEVLGLLRTCLDSTRPQRGLAARIEQRLDEIDVLLQLYTTFQAETASGASAALRARAGRLGEMPGGLGSEELEAFAQEAAEAGVLSPQGTLGGGDAGREQLRRLLRDVGAFATTAPAHVEAASDAVDPQALCAALARLRRAACAAGGLPPELDAAVREMTTAVRALTSVGLDDLMSQLGRTVEVLAPKLGKQAHLSATGTGVRVPAQVRAVLGDVLTHAIRNAIDHGLEDAGERHAAGKPEQGRIEVRVELDDSGDSVRLEVADDGRGVDTERVRARALERGLLASSRLGEMDEESLLELLFLPGFSTAQSVTDVSGRGVGMDAVRMLVEELGGHATLRSTRGRGTTLVLEVPLERAAEPSGEDPLAGSARS